MEKSMEEILYDFTAKVERIEEGIACLSLVDKDKKETRGEIRVRDIKTADKSEIIRPGYKFRYQIYKKDGEIGERFE